MKQDQNIVCIMQYDPYCDQRYNSEIFEMFVIINYFFVKIYINDGRDNGHQPPTVQYSIASKFYSSWASVLSFTSSTSTDNDWPQECNALNHVFLFDVVHGLAKVMEAHSLHTPWQSKV